MQRRKGAKKERCEEGKVRRRERCEEGKVRRRERREGGKVQRRERREEGKSAKHLISSQAIRKACDVIYSFSGGIYSRFEKQLNFSLIISIPYNVYLNTAFYSSSWLLTQLFTVAPGY